MHVLNKLLRIRINRKRQLQLQKREITLISSNCNGACILHDLGLKFHSPFVNLWIKPKDFLKLLGNLKHYMNAELVFIDEPGVSYPVGILDDVKIYFEHYKSREMAKQKWEIRAKRMDMDNIYVLFSDRDGCTYQDLCDFEALPFKNKAVFTHIPYPELTSAVYIPGWENEESVGLCSEYVSHFSGKKHYDAFDYVTWFNADKS